ncbi:MAG: diacylglycerol kinase, partial [Alphaproteobacteria bacterium]|nr:diacylglycerol kinase [Alphaproteobacteria bacterium]
MECVPDDEAGADPAGAKNQPFRLRLGYAVAGIRIVARREDSFRSQCRLAIAAIGTAALLRPAPIWWALLTLSIGLVLALECTNAALEYALDQLHPEQHPEVGHAKDAAAGAVLLASVAAACVGCLMLAAARMPPSAAGQPGNRLHEGNRHRLA